MVEYKKTLEEVKEYLEEHLADYSIEQYGTDMIVSDKDIPYEPETYSKGLILPDILNIDEVTFKPFLPELIDAMVEFTPIDEPERFEVVKKPIVLTAEIATHEQTIETLEGNMLAHAGDYILTGTEGERWAVKKHIFEKTYDILD